MLIVVLLVVALLVFGLSRAQGDPRLIYLTPTTSQEQWDAWGVEMGLDKPAPMQFLVWLGKVLRGDLGDSIREHRPVTEALLERVPATLQLGLGAWIFAFALGWPLGVLSAVKRGSMWDYGGRTLALFGQALPPFWLGIMLILIFSVQLEWLPVGRRGGISHFILPCVTLGWLAAAGQLRLVRSSMLEVMDSQYIQLARAKGVPPQLVIWKHALKNAAIPPLTYAGVTLAGFITGTVVTETVFAWPGLGRLAVESVMQNDFPMLSGAVLLVTLLYLSTSFLADIAYAYLDPRIRYE
jgi:peptide/nickel transport system permease protein